MSSNSMGGQTGSTKRAREIYVFREYAESVIVAVLIALVLRTFVIAAYKIPTGSMVPTLKVGDCIFAWKIPYGLRIPFTSINLLKPHLPDRGDVVVFRYPEDESLSFVKRAIGLPGDKIQIRSRRVFINDKILGYANLGAEAVSQLGDVPLSDQHIIQTETIGGKSHLVMFKRGEADDSYGPIVVPDGQIFVLGDNRDSSDDSRSWGMVPIDNLEGRTLMIWASFDWEHRFKNTSLPRLRTARLFSLIH